MTTFTVALVAFMAGICPAIMANSVIPDQRYVEAYTEPGCEGPVHIFTDYIPDLKDYLIDNAIKSARVTGTWILYSGTDYSDEGQQLLSGVNYCHSDLNVYEPSSLRYAGSPYGLNDVYYNLYVGNNWADAEFIGKTSVSTVVPYDLTASSLIITGQSPWTFFTGQDYTGVGVCVYPELHEENDDIEYDFYAVDSMDSIGLPDDSIRSVAKGCLGDNIVRIQPSKASSHPEGDHKVINNAH